MSDEEWQPPKDVRPWIVCAANRHASSGQIILGARHWDKLMQENFNLYMESAKSKKHVQGEVWDQGFIDQWGRFYTRKEAMKAVLDSGQPFNAERNCGGQESDDLFSEGLY
jgi:hypothetical protein